MGSIQAFVLPGMHGNAVLLEEFQRRAPDRFDVRVHELLDSEWSYDQLFERLEPLVAESQPCVLLAESFSGPLVVKLAAHLPDAVSHLVLVATFVTPPTPWIAKLVPWPLLFRLPMPRVSAEQWMVGKGHSHEFIDHVRAAVGRTPPDTLAKRMRQTMMVDATQDLAKVRCPVLYIQAKRDQMVPPRCLEAIRQVAEEGGVELRAEQLDGPHLILQTHPSECWALIDDFVGLAATG